MVIPGGKGDCISLYGEVCALHKPHHIEANAKARLRGSTLTDTHLSGSLQPAFRVYKLLSLKSRFYELLRNSKQKQKHQKPGFVLWRNNNDNHKD